MPCTTVHQRDPDGDLLDMGCRCVRSAACCEETFLQANRRSAWRDGRPNQPMDTCVAQREANWRA
ncbi:MAG: hypothetical protein ACK55I_04495, partial [bacterium]